TRSASATISDAPDERRNRAKERPLSRSYVNARASIACSAATSVSLPARKTTGPAARRADFLAVSRAIDPAPPNRRSRSLLHQPRAAGSRHRVHRDLARIIIRHIQRRITLNPDLAGNKGH